MDIVMNKLSDIIYQEEGHSGDVESFLLFQTEWVSSQKMYVKIKCVDIELVI